MFALKEEHFSPDFYDSWREYRHRNGEQCQLSLATGVIVMQTLLAMEVLQSTLEIQGLIWVEKK